jgi:hypothetical protein
MVVAFIILMLYLSPQQWHCLESAVFCFAEKEANF